MTTATQLEKRGAQFRTAGFTIIEVLLAGAIIALGAALAGFEIYRNLDRTALRVSARRILHAARYAHLLAAEHHWPCKLHIDFDSGKFWITAQPSGVPVSELDRDGGATPEQIVAENYAQPSRLGDNLRFSLLRTGQRGDVSRGQGVIAFHEDGTADAALLQISRRHETFTLLIYPWTSRAEMRDQPIAELPSDAVDARRAGWLR